MSYLFFLKPHLTTIHLVNKRSPCSTSTDISQFVHDHCFLFDRPRAWFVQARWLWSLCADDYTTSWRGTWSARTKWWSCWNTHRAEVHDIFDLRNRHTVWLIVIIQKRPRNSGLNCGQVATIHLRIYIIPSAKSVKKKTKLRNKIQDLMIRWLWSAHRLRILAGPDQISPLLIKMVIDIGSPKTWVGWDRAPDSIEHFARIAV